MTFGTQVYCIIYWLAVIMILARKFCLTYDEGDYGLIFLLNFNGNCARLEAQEVT